MTRLVLAVVAAVSMAACTTAPSSHPVPEAVPAASLSEQADGDRAAATSEPTSEPETSTALAEAQEAQLRAQLHALEMQIAQGANLPIESRVGPLYPFGTQRAEGVPREVALAWITRTEAFVRQRIDAPDLRGLEVAEFVRRAVDEQIHETQLPQGNLGLVSREDVRRYADAFLSILRRAQTDRQFRVTFQVLTTPSGARFELCREYVPTDCSAVGTNVTLKDVFRGKYIYKITRAGYHEVKEKLNLVNFGQRRLRCPLRALGNPAGAVPCTPE